jgi:hypothetical protein
MIELVVKELYNLLAYVACLALLTGVCECKYVCIGRGAVATNYSVLLLQYFKQQFILSGSHFLSSSCHSACSYMILYYRETKGRVK